MTAAAGAPTKQPLYFVHPVVDYALIGGVSILAFLGLSLFHDGSRTPALWTLSGILVWIINWPHFSATSYRLYNSRANLGQYPVTAVVVPVLLVGAVVGSFASPEGVAPWLVCLFAIWSPYHFSGQSVGITLIYARRAGFKVGRWERLAISGFIFGTFLVQTALTHTGQRPGNFYSVSYPVLGLPLWVASTLRVWMWVCGAAYLFFVVRWCVRNRRVLPPIVLLPAAAQFVWFVIGWRVPAFNEFVPFFHALQYMLIAWMMQLGERAAVTMPEKPKRFMVSESARWIILNVIGGAFLFWLLPRLGARAGFELPFATAVILSAVQIHHFFVDGVIWKLKNPRVSSPLMSSVDELLTGRERAATLRAA